MIHGVTELFAVTLAGAAGFSIGWAVAFPGERSRVDAAADAGRRAGTVMAGVVVMLFVAGLLEGFGRQLIVDDVARLSIAGATAVIWGVYFYLPRPGLNGASPA
ncbi:MAG: stage II sporulation protein M, partial [Caulobacteraceae bacterium]